MGVNYKQVHVKILAFSYSVIKQWIDFVLKMFTVQAVTVLHRNWARHFILMEFLYLMGHNCLPLKRYVTKRNESED